MSSHQEWIYNYFNYFTEIEEHFQRARGTGLFLLSPLDWAIIECWKNSGVPLEAVLRGIDAAFEKWRARRSKVQMINSLAYCAQAVLTEAQRIAAGGAAPTSVRKSAPLFSPEELRGYLRGNAAALRQREDPDLHRIAGTLEQLAGESEAWVNDLEELERRLTVLEDKMIARARTLQSEEQLLEARRELEIQLRPYRGKMSPEQLIMIEKQYLERILLEREHLPRLSIFYFP